MEDLPLLGTRKQVLGCLTILGVAISVCVLAVIVYGLQEERTLTGYIAQVGNVPATYTSVDAFLQREFPFGMQRHEVVAKIDNLFAYHRFVGGTAPDSPHVFIICFPEKGCTDEQWQQGKCRCVFYQFWFAGDTLRDVQREKP